MGAKKKSGKSVRRVAKEQRRTAKRSRRQELQRRASRPAERSDAELLRAALPFLDESDQTSGDSRLDEEQLIRTLMQGEELADEPEFEELVFEPMSCLRAYMDASRAAGIDLEQDADEEPAAEQLRDRTLEVLAGVARQVLTDGRRGEILRRLERLQARLKKAGLKQQAGIAALARLALENEPKVEVVMMIGVVRGLLTRGIDAGLELARRMHKYAEIAEAGDPDLPLADRVKQALGADQAASFFEGMPGLSKIMSEDLDRRIEEGIEAAFRGELYLGLFGFDELSGLVAVLKEHAPSAQAEAPEEPPQPAGDLSAEQKERLHSAMKQYVAGLLTPQRREAICARLKQALEEPEFRKHIPFVGYLLGRMEQTELDDYDLRVAATLILGEVRGFAAAAEAGAAEAAAGEAADEASGEAASEASGAGLAETSEQEAPEASGAGPAEASGAGPEEPGPEPS